MQQKSTKKENEKQNHMLNNSTTFNALTISFLTPLHAYGLWFSVAYFTDFTKREKKTIIYVIYLYAQSEIRYYIY